jgi:hypothetical protein
MATRLYAMGANSRLEDIIEGVGVANSAGVINFAVDLTTSAAYNSDGTTRAITKAEVIEGIEVLKQYIIRGTWTPA